MAKTPSLTMQKARKWIEEGGRVSVRITTIYGKRKVQGCYSSRRGMEFRAWNADGVTFIDLTKFQAKSFLTAEQWASIEAMEAVEARRSSKQFRDKVDLNMECRTNEKLKNACRQWAEGTHDITDWVF